MLGFLSFVQAASTDPTHSWLNEWNTLLLRQDVFTRHMTVLSMTAVLALLISYYCWYQRTLSQRLGGMPVMHHPPQGRSWPWLGQALNFLKYRPWDLLTAWNHSYGPVVCFTLVGKTMFSVGWPDQLKIVLQSKISAVKKDVGNTMKDFLVILGNGIVTSENQSWMKQRLKMSHPLRFDVLQIIPKQTLQAVQHLMQTWDVAAAAGKPIPLGQSLRHLTLQVISGSFLSLSAQESDSTFAQLYLPIVDECNVRVWHPYRQYCVFLPSWWKHVWNVHQLNAYVSHLIRQRWQVRRQTTTTTTSQEPDILDRILLAYEKDVDPDIPQQLPEFVVRQLRDEIKTFVLAGHETSAAMMTWAFYELMGQDTALMQPLLDEACTVFDPTQDWSRVQASHLPNADSLSGLVYAEATLRESLRKYSVVPIVARRTIDDLTLGQYFIPKGSSIIINIQAVHLHPDLWPNPMKYDPTRFLPENAANIQPYTFLPFIAGPRNCLGQHLALLESKMVMALLVQRYKLSLEAGQTVVTENWQGDQDPRHRYMVPVIPKQELMVQVERR